MIIVPFRNHFFLTKTFFHYNFVSGNNNVKLKTYCYEKDYLNYHCSVDGIGT